MRALRLVLGLIILVQGIQAHETMYAIAGLLLSAMAIANIGCCGPGGCGLPQRPINAKEPVKEIEYEEVS